MVRLDSVQAFIRYQIAGSPLASHADLCAEALLALIADIVTAELDSPAGEEPIAFPLRATTPMAW
jgi:hypothetical protein